MDDALRADLREAYNRKAAERDQGTPVPWKVAERQYFLSSLREEQKRTLLEVGAGTGKDSLFFQEHGLEVTCIDLTPEMVRLCRQKGLRAYVMDAGDLRFPTASFDAVYALNSLLHLPKRELPAVLQAINTVLKPAGLFYMGVYGGYDHEGIWPDDPYEPQRFFSFFSDEHLQRVVAPFFDVLSFKRILLEGHDRTPHFQSLILRKKEPC